jgi:hypothetical protein
MATYNDFLTQFQSLDSLDKINKVKTKYDETYSGKSKASDIAFKNAYQEAIKGYDTTPAPTNEQPTETNTQAPVNNSFEEANRAELEAT